MNTVFTWPVGRAADNEPRTGIPPAAPVFAYVVGSILGGMATAAGLAAVGAATRAFGATQGEILLSLAPLVLIAALSQAVGSVWPLPERRAQVPTRWLLWHHTHRTAFAFGLVIGAGVFTHLRQASAWTVAVLVAAAPSVALALVLGEIYGAARASSLVITWVQDRAQRPRIDWYRLAGPRTLASRSLAILALASFVAAATTST